MKRSPLLPGTKGFKRPTPEPKIRLRKCSICTARFKPSKPLQNSCGVECAIEAGRRKKAALERRNDRLKKLDMKPRSQWIREAQAAFNAFVRERDKDLPCISCGRFHTGSYDAGHYRSVGAMPALRFHLSNVHKQCVPCNQHKGGNIVEYRIRLIDKIGAPMVDWLEMDHPPAKYTIDDAKAIKAQYKELLVELRAR